MTDASTAPRVPDAVSAWFVPAPPPYCAPASLLMAARVLRVQEARSPEELYRWLQERALDEGEGIDLVEVALSVPALQWGVSHSYHLDERGRTETLQRRRDEYARADLERLGKAQAKGLRVEAPLSDESLEGYLRAGAVAVVALTGAHDDPVGHGVTLAHLAERTWALDPQYGCAAWDESYQRRWVDLQRETLLMRGQ